LAILSDVLTVQVALGFLLTLPTRRGTLPTLSGTEEVHNASATSHALGNYRQSRRVDMFGSRSY